MTDTFSPESLPPILMSRPLAARYLPWIEPKG